MTLLLGIKGLSWLAAFAAVAFGFMSVPAGEGGGGAADDAGAGAGGDDAGADADDASNDNDGGTVGDDADAGDDDARHAADDADDDDDPDDPASLPKDLTDPANLRTRYRRLQRHSSTTRRLAERLRDKNGQFLPPQEVDRILSRAREQDELEAFLNEHTDLKQALLDRFAGKSRKPAAATDDEDEVFQDPFAKDDDVPWDTTTPSGRAFLETFRRNAREIHELRVANRRLERSVGDVSTRETQRTIEQHAGRAKTATLKAAEAVPAEWRPTFVRSVQRAFELAVRDKALSKFDVNRIIQEELAPYQKAAKGQRRTTVADTQRRAEGNKNLPRTNGSGRTVPANANDSNKVGTIKDARKSFFARIGQSAPPGR